MHSLSSRWTLECLRVKQNDRWIKTSLHFYYCWLLGLLNKHIFLLPKSKPVVQYNVCGLHFGINRPFVLKKNLFENTKKYEIGK